MIIATLRVPVASEVRAKQNATKAMANARIRGDTRAMPCHASKIAAASFLIGIFAIAACTTDYQLGKGDPNYGGPNALAGQRPPGPADVGDGGTSSGGTSSGGTSSKAKCVAAGGTLASTATCTVSLSKDILPAFAKASCSTANCHGGANPRSEPRIEPSDGPAMWQEFQNFTLSTGKVYINPCSTDEATSAMGCNLLAVGQAGACGSHMPVGGQIEATAMTKISAWLKCGSPNN
jgi:hypothetical protein